MQEALAEVLLTELLACLQLIRYQKENVIVTKHSLESPKSTLPAFFMNFNSSYSHHAVQ